MVVVKAQRTGGCRGAGARSSDQDTVRERSRRTVGDLLGWAIGLTVVPACDALGVLSVEMLRPLLRAAWGPDTCDPHGLEDWLPDNPARGQCGVTALVVQDLLGGDLVLGEVYVGQTKVSNHYWNRLPDGAEIDLTADQ